MSFSSAGDPPVPMAYLQEIRKNAVNASEEEKDLLVDKLPFLPALGEYLKSPAVALLLSEIIQILSKGSAFRSAIIMEEVIGSSLAWVAV